MTRRRTPIATALICCSAVAAAADTAAPQVTFPTPESDSQNYLSDRITRGFDSHAHVVDTTKANLQVDDGCVPADTELKGIGKAKYRAPGNGPEESLWAFRVKKLAAPSKPDGARVEQAAKAAKAATRRCNDDNRVAVGDVVLLSQDTLTSLPPHRFGLTYGTLLVPYKYQLKGNREFSGATTLGGYFGYREAYTGAALQAIVFAGASSIPVSETADGTTTTRNLTGLSYGVGLLGTVKDGFQLGLVLGTDRVGAGASYVNNGKAWLAVSLGFAFSN